MAASPEQLSLLHRARAEGLMELAPVVLPVNPLGDNDHMGWPVATTAGGTIVVIHRRIPGHNPKGAGRGGADSTFSLATRSTDGGATWSDSYDLRDAMGAERNRGGELPLSHRYKFGPFNPGPQGYKLHLNAIGTAGDSAEWRREATLYRRGGSFYRDGDGFHPAGAIIDATAGVQHVFIYMGHPNGPAGSFRLTRTLDTPRLAEFLRSA